jgi:hypothetical protein
VAVSLVTNVIKEKQQLRAGFCLCFILHFSLSLANTEFGSLFATSVIFGLLLFSIFLLNLLIFSTFLLNLLQAHLS